MELSSYDNNNNNNFWIILQRFKLEVCVFQTEHEAQVLFYSLRPSVEKNIC